MVSIQTVTPYRICHSLQLQRDTSSSSSSSSSLPIARHWSSTQCYSIQTPAQQQEQVNNNNDDANISNTTLDPTNTTDYQSGGIIDHLDDESTTTAAAAATTTTTTTPLLGIAGGVPSFQTLFLFVGTTILILLSEPLLSLVDTTIVGQTATVVQLAALGPATMLIDSSFYLTYFLAISTTNTMATNIAKGDYKSMVQAASQVLTVAAALGGLITLVCFGFGRPLITWLAGSSSSPELVRLALSYAQIRSAVAPLAIMGMVAQSICLACLDTKTPAVAVAAASVVNIVGDVLLVKALGIVGAAVATAAASVVATSILVRQVTKKMDFWNQKITPASAVTTSPLPPPANKKKPRSMLRMYSNMKDRRMIQQPKLLSPLVPYMSWPDNASLLKLLRLAGPIFFVIVGKVICYSAMSMRATGYDLTTLATYNVMLRIFFFLATFGDSLSQASQTFVPQVLVGSNKNTRQQVVHKLLRRLTIMATAIGLWNTNVSRFIIRHCGTYFTKDPSILVALASHSTYLSLSLLLHPFIMLFEGAIIATKDFGYLVGTYVNTMIFLFGLLQYSTMTFHGVWRAMFLFQVARLVQFAHRVWVKMIIVLPSKGQPPRNENVVVTGSKRVLFPSSSRHENEYQDIICSYKHNSSNDRDTRAI
jgi:Na+-driven multidrug efflux pump